MGHTYTRLLIHYAFSTKERRPLLREAVSDGVNAYFSGIASRQKMHLLRAGGVADHRHLLVQIPPALSVAEAVGILKANSSGWMKDEFPGLAPFGWQEGYAAFSVSESAVPKVIAYIDGQEAHHRKMTFEEELVALLKRHGVTYDLARLLE